MNKSVAIIIPLYKPYLSPLEDIAVKQCFDVLSAYKIIAIKPKHLSLDAYPFHFEEVIDFEDQYFENIAGYNQLMLSALFYEKFLTYNYVLIYQTDAFVFKDELNYWCNQGYDYIGAPWLRYVAYPDLIKKVKNTSIRFLHTKLNKKIKGSELPTQIQSENRVGNGGFSLRNTKKFFEVCLQREQTIALYNRNSSHHFNEDIFWGVEVNRYKKHLKIPDYKTAILFSMENYLNHAFKITNGELPFGCHAWCTANNIDTWRPIFKQAGFDI